jgi:sugar-specific transcriptional regulator TrmB
MKDLKEFLAEYGLSDKEASVYLTMLELGPASVQDISKKSGVNRATTYVMIESLKRRGLMSTFDKGKKTMFNPESPERLKRLIEKDLRVIQEKEDRLKEAMPSFLALFQSSGEHKPNVRFFEGEEGVKTAREILLYSQSEILTFHSVDEGTHEVSKIDEKQRLHVGKQLHGKMIVAVKPGLKLPHFDKTNWQARSIAYETSPFTGDVYLFNGHVLFAMHKTKPIAVLIENQEIYNLLTAMFMAIWNGASHHQL